MASFSVIRQYCVLCRYEFNYQTTEVVPPPAATQTSNPTSPAKAVFNSRFKHVGAEIRAGLNYEFEWLHREPAWSADDAKPSRRPRFRLPIAHRA
jgi:hypothetical protein